MNRSYRRTRLAIRPTGVRLASPAARTRRLSSVPRRRQRHRRGQGIRERL